MFNSCTDMATVNVKELNEKRTVTQHDARHCLKSAARRTVAVNKNALRELIPSPSLKSENIRRNHNYQRRSRVKRSHYPTNICMNSVDQHFLCTGLATVVQYMHAVCSNIYALRYGIKWSNYVSQSQSGRRRGGGGVSGRPSDVVTQHH